MADTQTLDKAFFFVMRRFVESGRAPHYTELAADMGTSMEVGRELLHEVVEGGYNSAWFYPETDYIVSFAPFNNLPTQYRVTIDGEQKWFAQGGLEALAVRWLFPGKTVVVDAPCLDCGAPIQLEMRDDHIVKIDPPEMVGYSAARIGDPRPEGHGWRGAQMNLFRSEEHARNWSGWNPTWAEQLQPLSYWIERFAGERMRNRGRTDYVSWRASQST